MAFSADLQIPDLAKIIHQKTDEYHKWYANLMKKVGMEIKKAQENKDHKRLEALKNLQAALTEANHTIVSGGDADKALGALTRLLGKMEGDPKLGSFASNVRGMIKQLQRAKNPQPAGISASRRLSGVVV